MKQLMSAQDAGWDRESSEPNLSLLDGEIVEFSLLLPGWQAAALEATARSQGLTTGEMVRHLIQDFFCKFAKPRSA
jgi:hypothetical protein